MVDKRTSNSSFSFRHRSTHKINIICYNTYEVMNMKEAYNNSLLMLKILGIRLTRKQYTELAKRFNLLSIQSLQFMSNKSYESIMKEIQKESKKAKKEIA